MGVWAYPFKTIDIAKKFSSKMKKPWMAKVEKDEEGFYRWSASDLGFLKDDTLYGDDSLWDYLGEVASKKKKDFDIRPYVEECLMYHIWYFEHFLETEFDSKALQIVHESLNLKFTKNDIEPFLNELKSLILVLKENGISVLKYDVIARDPKLKWTLNNYNLPQGLPPSHKSKKIYSIKLFVDTKTPIAKILKDKFNIIKIAPFKDLYIKTKGVGYLIFLETKKTSKAIKEKKSIIELDKSKIKRSLSSTIKSKSSSKSLNLKSEYKMICTANGSNKFWNAKRVKNKVYLTFGPVGYDGRTTVKTFSTEEKAIDFLADKVREKLSKKYK